MKRAVVIIAALAALALPASALALSSTLYGAVRHSNGSLCTSGCRMYYKNNSTGSVNYIGAGGGNSTGGIVLSYPAGNIYVLVASFYYNSWVAKSVDYSFNIWGWENCPVGGGAHLSPIHTMGPGYGSFKDRPWWTGNLTVQSGCVTG